MADQGAHPFIVPLKRDSDGVWRGVQLRRAPHPNLLPRGEGTADMVGRDSVGPNDSTLQSAARQSLALPNQGTAAFATSSSRR